VPFYTSKKRTEKDKLSKKFLVGCPSTGSGYHLRQAQGTTHSTGVKGTSNPRAGRAGYL